MSYVPPQVEITQTQKTVGVVASTPTLLPAVIGPAYYVVDLEDYSLTSPFISGATNTYDLALLGFNPLTMKLNQIDVYADLYLASGLSIPVRKHLTLTTDFTVSYTQGATNSVTILTNSTTAPYTSAKVYIGFRAMYNNGNKVQSIDKDNFASILGDGNNSSLNPLGLAVSSALTNAGNKSLLAYGVRYDSFTSTTGSGNVTESAEHVAAQNDLSLLEMYMYAPVTNTNSIQATYVTEATTWSTPTNKKERRAYVCPKISWTNSVQLTTNKTADAILIQNYALASQQKRVSYIFPDVGYNVENQRHITTLSPTYVRYVSGFTGYSAVHAIMNKTVQLSSTHPTTAYQSKFIYAGTEIDSVLHAQLLLDPNLYKFDVRVPVNNAIFTAAIAGQRAGLKPEQPLTNLPLNGPVQVKYSSDWFNETQLNTIAQGGNYILMQSTVNQPVVCRHHLTTDMTSIQTREDSIVTTVDYVAKTIRNTISPSIGRRVIDENFLVFLTAAINAVGRELSLPQGPLTSFKLAALYQDTTNQDTIRCTINIIPKYPVNYIKIDLVF